MPARVGIWLIGAFGGVGGTVALGLAAIARGLKPPVGMVTALPPFAALPLDAPGQFVVGGHDVCKGDFAATAERLHGRSGIFTSELIAACKPDLDAWTQNVRPGTVLRTGAMIERMADLPDAVRVRTCREAVTRLQADLTEFRKTHNLEQVVVINVASTEPLIAFSPDHATWDRLNAQLDAPGEPILPASSLYALAAIESGMAYVNFTPSLGACVPALRERALVKKVPLAGKDGKTGETLLKTVLAPMFAARHLNVLSWIGHNILGGGDGMVLNDPANKASKVRTKDAVLDGILGYKPQTHVSIEYVESLDDWKTAWDHIHFAGFLGTKMSLQFTWQGCDSILAAPLVIDLARLTLLAQRRGEVGVLAYLACFFKSPLDFPEADFFRQWTALHDHLAS